MNNLTHIAARLFDTPLLIEPNRLDHMLSAIWPRLTEEGFKLYGPGDPDKGSRNERDYLITKDGVAVIPIIGSLVKRGSWMDSLCGMASYDMLSEHILDAATHPDVSTILLDLDTPGGEASGVMDLSDLIYEVRNLKRVVAVANEMAFSAGYAIASAAHEVVVSRTAGVGSVGVITVHRDVSQAAKQAGIKYTVIKAGEHKDDYSPYQPLSRQAEGRIQTEVDRLYDLFAETVARNRNLSVQAVKETEAGLFFGGRAVEAKLADSVGTFADTLANLTKSLNYGSQSSQRAKSATVEVAPMAETTPEPAAESPVPPVETESAPSNVVDLSAARTDGRSEGIQYTTEIFDLCTLAGKTNLAGDFIKQGMTAEAVRHSLLASAAQESDALEIAGRSDASVPTTKQPVIDTAAIYEARAKAVRGN